MSKTLDNIGIFIRQINTAAIADVAVNNCNLLMVSVVKGQSVDIFMDRGKHCQSNTGLDKLITKFCGVDSQAAKVIDQ